MEEPIPAEVQDFILRYIDSVAHLEALLLMWRDPAARWDAASMAKRIYTTELDAAELLARLTADGFIRVADDRYQYECADRSLQETVVRLAAAYSRYLIPVTNLIHSKPRRIREFAEAFKFRKDR